MVALNVLEEGTLYFCVCAYSLIYVFNTPVLEYNCFTGLLVSVAQQCESAICIHISA